jgi:hypothetical protein
MKYNALLIVSILFAGCSKHTWKNTNIGVVEISVGKASRHILADGRELILTPTSINADGTVGMIASFAGESFTNSNVKIGQTAIYLGDNIQAEMTIQISK